MNAEATRLLLVDDDVRLLEAIARYLSHAGYAVELAHDGTAAMTRFHAAPPDVVVLDIMMPGMDGWEVCRRLREVSNVPIIMLTARTGESDRVMGLRLGADDYVVKPFSLRELAARIEAVLRRARATRPPPGGEVVFDDGWLRLERSGWEVLRDGVPIALTSTERRLLFALAERRGQAIPNAELLRQVWGPGYARETNYVKLYVWRVRQKIEPDPVKPVYLRTARGLGYLFAGPAPGGRDDRLRQAS